MDDMNKAISQLQGMLSSEDGRKQIEGIMGGLGLGGGSSSGDAEAEQTAAPAAAMLSGLSGLGGFSMDSFARIRGVMDGLNMEGDPRVQLLGALRPYIKRRGKHIDNAIKIMSLGKIPGMLKGMKK